MQDVAINFETIPEFKMYLATRVIPELSWCITGMAFLPSVPRLFELGTMNGYMQVPSKSFSFLYWTALTYEGDQPMCLRDNIGQRDGTREYINMENTD